MPSRIEVIGESEFNPREWLRRDVLWASIVTPYPRQLAGWLDGESAQKQHSNNVSRIEQFASYTGNEMAAEAFRHRGKNIAGMISSIALFQTLICQRGTLATTNLRVQARSVDHVLNRFRRGSFDTSFNDEAVYAECVNQVRLTAGLDPSDEIQQFGYNKRFRTATKYLTGLVCQEVGLWLAEAEQNDKRTKPVLVVENGGVTRGSGPSMERLGQQLAQTEATAEYQDLAIADPDFSFKLAA
jgi:hypothetical protein